MTLIIFRSVAKPPLYKAVFCYYVQVYPLVMMY